MKKSILYFLLLFFSSHVFAQQITFEKKYDYSYHAEGGCDLVQTSDGGYMIAGGQSITFGYVNMLTLRTDSLGNELWTKFTGSGGEWTTIKILQLNDSVFYTAGNSNVFTALTSDRDFLLLKIDQNGDTIWTRT